MRVPKNADKRLEQARAHSVNAASAWKEAKAKRAAAKNIVSEKEEAVLAAEKELKTARRAAKSMKRAVAQARATSKEADKALRELMKKIKKTHRPTPARRPAKSK